jgi:hypothetical protein
VATEFRTDGEWKDIIHLIRMTAFELGILLNEKLTDTTAIPHGAFDVNKDPGEFLTSVLLNNPSTPQRRFSIDDSVNAHAHPSVEDTGDFDVYFSGHGHPNSSEPSAAFIDGFSSDTSRSSFPYIPETPTPAFDWPTLMRSTRLTDLRDNRLLTIPIPQRPVVIDYPVTDIQTSNDSSQASEPLVTGHAKVCLWCEREGKSHDGTPPAEPNLDFYESREFDAQCTNETNEASVPTCAKLDIQQIASVDVNTEGSNDLHKPGELPGLRRVEDLPHLLYRWSNTNSQGINTERVLVAGWFTADYPDVGSPALLSQSDFLNVFAAHVTRVQVPTPFISAFARPLAPIHRAVRNRQKAKISIIDSRKLPNPVFHAQPLARITKTTVKRWKGYGEYAIWGYVPSEAIICTFDIADLEEIASRDLEIQQFLQLSLIEEQETCHRRLRRDLRENINTCSYDDNRSVLRRLAYGLDVPEEYHEYFAMDIYEAWTLDLGPTYQDREDPDDPEASPEDREEPENPETSPALIFSEEAHCPHQVSQRVMRCNSESTTSYVPPKSDDGSCSESISEEEDDMSQSQDIPCPRRDTPSPAFSVVSDTDDSVLLNFPRPRAREVEMVEVAVPPTPPSTSRYFARSANVHVNASSAIQPLTLSRLSLSNSLNDDDFLSEGGEWPSDGDTVPGTDTPTRSFYFGQHANDGESGMPPVSRHNIQGQNPFVFTDDEEGQL